MKLLHWCVVTLPLSGTYLLLVYLFIYLFMYFMVLGLELPLSYSTSHFLFVKCFFKKGFGKLFAWAGFKPQSF
jgi:hypothetical protein